MFGTSDIAIIGGYSVQTGHSGKVGENQCSIFEITRSIVARIWALVFQYELRYHRTTTTRQTGPKQLMKRISASLKTFSRSKHRYVPFVFEPDSKTAFLKDLEVMFCIIVSAQVMDKRSNIYISMPD